MCVCACKRIQTLTKAGKPGMRTRQLAAACLLACMLAHICVCDTGACVLTCVCDRCSKKAARPPSAGLGSSRATCSKSSVRSIVTHGVCHRSRVSFCGATLVHSGCRLHVARQHQLHVNSTSNCHPLKAGTVTCKDFHMLRIQLPSTKGRLGTFWGCPPAARPRTT